jgi:hypothetical protein
MGEGGRVWGGEAGGAPAAGSPPPPFRQGVARGRQPPCTAASYIDDAVCFNQDDNSGWASECATRGDDLTTSRYEFGRADLRRPVYKIGLYCAAGVLLTMLTAWLEAWRLPWRMTVSGTPTSAARGYGDFRVVSMTELGRTRVLVVNLASSDRPRFVPPVLANLEVPLWAIKQDAGVDIPYWTAVATGSPFRAFSGIVWFSLSQDKECATGALLVDGRRVVPLTPMWSGLSLDAAVYGAFIGFVDDTLRRARRYHRRRNGKCPWCGYVLSGIEAKQCPECGRSRAAK